MFSTILQFLFNTLLKLPAIYFVVSRLHSQLEYYYSILMKSTAKNRGKLLFNGVIVFSVSFAILVVFYVLLDYRNVGLVVYHISYYCSIILGCSVVSIQIPTNVAYANWVEPEFMSR